MNKVVRLAVMGALLAAAVPALSATPVTLTVASFPDLDRDIKVAIPLYKKIHPEVEIKLVSRERVDHVNAMTTQLASGTGLPDLVGLEIGFVGRFVASGGLEDLSKAPYNVGQFQNLVTSYSWAQAKGPNGDQYAIPVDIGPGTMFYRKDLLDKAGVSEADLNKSWESYIAAGKKIKAATGAYLVASPVDIKDIYIRSNLKNGEGIYFDKSGKVIVAGNPRFENAFKLAKEAQDAGIAGNIKQWTNDWAAGFQHDQIATQPIGAWLNGHLAHWLAPDEGGKWRATNLPQGAYASWGGSFYAIPAKSAHKAEAYEFLKFLTLNRDQQLATFKEMDAFPSLKSAQDDPIMSEPLPYLGGQKAREMWREAAKHIPEIPINKNDGVAEDIINDQLDQVVHQNKDIKAALADAQADIDRRARR
ncbi:multiple sugar transport system substrate-binding protein [Silvimonas terrae]|uniref:Multiple sugar transport system substrate-binding protein n=1 Tax=Silvimonas terrae TaxID=300266 RepID=A0A840RAT1_9NEIS|nr:extracellular solute-binding protein [Silvimonas terrae]MBB5189452.1 multiple sugar transport system substrate-binding protein [Silvimonas terrae]